MLYAKVKPLETLGKYIEQRKMRQAPETTPAQFKLTLGLREGHDLLAMDRNRTTSDPYVKVKLDSHTTYRTQTIKKQLNPVWNETCEILLDHLGQKLALALYDYDRGSISDDFLGRADIDLLKLDFDILQEHKLDLQNTDAAIHSGASSYRGYVIVTTCLQRLNKDDSKFVKRGAFSNQQYHHVVEVVIGNICYIGVPDLAVTSSSSPSLTANKSEFYLQIGYAGEWQQTKPKPFPKNTCMFPLRKSFHFYITDKTSSGELFLELWDQDAGVIGQTSIALESLSIEQTHKFEKPFTNNRGFLQLTVAITGSRPDVIAETEDSRLASTWTPHGPPLISPKLLRQEDEKEWMDQLNKKIARSVVPLPGNAVGALVLKVIQAKHLRGADLSGKSDPFVSIEIVNIRLRTHTEHKTLYPKWNRSFIIPIHDIHSIVNVTVFDDDEDTRPDFLGKIAVPILAFQQGERRWFNLKSNRLNDSTSRGSLELEGHLFYNTTFAALRSFDPKEENYLFAAKEEKLNIPHFQRRLGEFWQLRDKALKIVNIAGDILSWASPKLTILVLFGWILLCYMFEIWMAPLIPAILFTTTYFFTPYLNGNEESSSTTAKQEPSNESSNNDDKSAIALLQEQGLIAQQSLDMIMTLQERLKNLFFWRGTPWISAFATVMFWLTGLLLSFVSLRWVIMAYGVYEIVKKRFRPNVGFEPYNLITRAYTNEEVKVTRNL